jgi:hypothetical protein
MELSWRSVAFAFAPEFLPQRAVNLKKIWGQQRSEGQFHPRSGHLSTRYICQALILVLSHFLFVDVNFNRIQAEVMSINEPSKKVLLKNGFIKEGTLRQATLWSGKGIVDLEMYSVLKEDYVK